MVKERKKVYFFYNLLFFIVYNIQNRKIYIPSYTLNSIELQMVNNKGEKMKVSVRLLKSMKDNIWYREKDFMNKLSPYLALEEKRDELRKNTVKYFWFLKGHTALNSMLYYCVKRGYIERRKRTKRNYEYRRKISLKDLGVNGNE